MKSVEKLTKIHSILKKEYPRFNFYNKDRIFDEILYIFLSWRTPITKAQEIFKDLEKEFRQWDELLNLDENDWYKRLITGGKARDKARTVKKLILKLYEDFGSLENVETLSEKSDDEVYNYLTGLPGIKDKSAYCVMLYTMGRAVFPADAHCLRVSQRIGVISGTNHNKQDRVRGQKELNDLLKGNFELCYDLHIDMIHHGQKICKKRPLCQECVISSYCYYFKDQQKVEISD